MQRLLARADTQRHNNFNRYPEYTKLFLADKEVSLFTVLLKRVETDRVTNETVHKHFSVTLSCSDRIYCTSATQVYLMKTITQ